MLVMLSHLGGGRPGGGLFPQDFQQDSALITFSFIGEWVELICSSIYDMGSVLILISLIYLQSFPRKVIHPPRPS
jgi:hypothetical protein